MTATDLSKLADLLDVDSLPGWFRNEVDRKSEEIVRALEQGRSITLRGPKGEEITIVSPSEVQPTVV